VTVARIRSETEPAELMPTLSADHMFAASVLLDKDATFRARFLKEEIMEDRKCL